MRGSARSSNLNRGAPADLRQTAFHPCRRSQARCVPGRAGGPSLGADGPAPAGRTPPRSPRALSPAAPACAATMRSHLLWSALRTGAPPVSAPPSIPARSRSQRDQRRDRHRELRATPDLAPAPRCRSRGVRTTPRALSSHTGFRRSSSERDRRRYALGAAATRAVRCGSRSRTDRPHIRAARACRIAPRAAPRGCTHTDRPSADPAPRPRAARASAPPCREGTLHANRGSA